MVQHTAVAAAGSPDPISDAVVSPQASLLVRQILQAALQNAAGSQPPPAWVPEAQALLANVMMNDYLNWWNPGFPVDPNNVLAIANVSNPVSPLEYHARGLVRRGQGDPNGASADFDQARRLAPTFARAHAQAGNQQALLGQPQNSHQDFQNARNLNPRHPAIGYFDWGEGRAYFEDGHWARAIDLLSQSVTELPTVWYNRCYLAAAQNAAGDTAAANRTVQDFINNFDQTTFDRIKQLKPNPNDPPPVAAARKRVLDFVQPRLP